MAQDLAPPPAPRFRVYVGTYTGGPSDSKGIYQFELETATGLLIPKGLAAETPSPSFLAIHPSRKYLYAANEVGKFQGKPTGSVSAFAIDPKLGKLTLLNEQASAGADPCFVTVDATGGNPVGRQLYRRHDRRPADRGRRQACTRLGDDPAQRFKRQQISPIRASCAHSINLDATNRIAVAADLGLDKLLLYRFDPQRGKLTPNIPSDASLKAGSGPRHFAFHPDGHHAYAINELTSTVTVFDYDASRGTLSDLQTIATRPQAHNAPGNSTAEVVIHPSGPVPLRVEPRRRHPGHLRDRPRFGQAHHRRLPAHRGQNPAQLCDRPHRGLSPGRQPGFEHDRRLPHRPPDRPAQIHRRADLGAQTGLHPVLADRRMIVT